ncbi:SpoIIE family protein phosphatase [Streptomyces monticola]|uniref:SpoIIE family protein phosphatase n=1 Tax=Streptomyces monticola TaxID=2666263 RepID=A0ABW2JHQ1_9ACTN
MQRETVFQGSRASSPPGFRDARACASTTLPGNPMAPGAARRFVRAALADWTETGQPASIGITERLADDAVVLVSELVTNAVVHAGTNVELTCRMEYAGESADGEGTSLVLEVSDHHPARAVRGENPKRSADSVEYGRGLQLVSCLSESWGITYRTGTKTVWARLPVDGVEAARQIEAYAGEQALERGLRVVEILDPTPNRVREAGEWGHRGALTFLAEASDLLAGQLDEDMVAALSGQLLVPRLADWCAVWLDDETGPRVRSEGSAALVPRLARVWHTSENRIEELRRLLEKDPPRHQGPLHGGAVPVPWPADGPIDTGGTALAYRLIAGGRGLGTLMVGRAGLARFPDEVTGLLEDFSRRVALAIGAARQYTRQATISRILQRGLLPSYVAQVPGVESALVYEPRDKGLAGGDFYDVFPAADGRWCFALGDVCGNGPEAAVVTGLARPWLRLLAREGYQVADVLSRLNRALLDDAMEAAEAAARAVAAAGIDGLVDDGSPTRFLSVLYGELVPTDEGVRCTLACAGHPLPLVLSPDGKVRAVADPQVLLGVMDDVAYTSETFLLAPGETLLCVTDGVTERRSGPRQFDDDDGLAQALASCAGLSAPLVAERIRRLVHDFSEVPSDDDLALLVLQAR